jgi:hypothetical protein
MDLISAAIIEAAIAQAKAKLCENCGADKEYTVLIDADGSSQSVCKLCADTWQMNHRQLVLHCFNRVLEQLRKLQ